MWWIFIIHLLKEETLTSHPKIQEIQNFTRSDFMYFQRFWLNGADILLCFDLEWNFSLTYATHLICDTPILLSDKIIYNYLPLIICKSRKIDINKWTSKASSVRGKSSLYALLMQFIDSSKSYIAYNYNLSLSPRMTWRTHWKFGKEKDMELTRVQWRMESKFPRKHFVYFAFVIVTHMWWCCLRVVFCKWEWEA